MHPDEVAAIVGAGHGGAELSVALREQGWRGRIVLIGDEPGLPYHRPPLSKAFLAGATDEASLSLRGEAAYDKAGVERWGSVRVTSIERASRRIVLADGRELKYSKLALATGGRARRLPAALLPADATNVHVLRTLADAQGLRSQMAPGVRLVVVGAGYVGLEVAASAIKLGLQVSVLESAARVLARVTAPEISAFYEQAHRAAGVDLRTGVQVSGFELDPSTRRVTAVHLADGSVLPVDIVLVGIGQEPNVELAREAGLHVDNGVVVDEYSVTSDAHIVAIGDCSNHPSTLYGTRLRLESVPNALEQARSAAATLVGKHKPYHAVPWFWSDQYDLKLKTVGLAQGYEGVVLRGDPASRSFSAFYLQGRRVLAVDTISRAPDFLLAKRLVGEAVEVDPGALADEGVALKTLLPAAAVAAPAALA
jgi:3-phenylpropionate/trans-cinnamate dioxygenase ferredoxin reductase subunit